MRQAALALAVLVLAGAAAASPERASALFAARRAPTPGLAAPHGGPMPNGHRSHQIGLGADIWLRKVRPWWGHDSHMQVRRACPEGAAGCIPQEPPPAGDSCGAELD